MSTSAGSPAHATSATRSGRSPHQDAGALVARGGQQGPHLGCQAHRVASLAVVGRNRDRRGAGGDRGPRVRRDEGLVAESDDDGAVPAAPAAAESPACSDVACPADHSGLATTMALGCTRSARSTAPVTTSTSSSPAASAALDRPRHQRLAAERREQLVGVAREPRAAPRRRAHRRDRSPVDGALGVAQRRRLAAGAQGDDLGADRDGRLLGRAGADVEADRAP